MKKRLPVKEDVVVKTECWTLIKMAIIQTLPNYEDWLYSHMNIYYDPCRGEVYFGSSFNPEGPDYFSDILDIEELDFYMVSPDCLIDFVKRQLDDEYYFVLMINDTRKLLHEVFLFGYDEDLKVFNTISLTDNVGLYNNYISYMDLHIGFKEAIDIFKQDPTSYYFNRGFCFLMSRIKPRQRYVNRDYAPEYFAKMCSEAYGMRATFQCSDRDETYLTTQKYYTGISCLLVLKDLLCNEINHLSFVEIVKLRRSFFKLYEHRCMILNAMIWYESKWMITNNELIQLKREYAKCCDGMYKLCMMFLKYEQTSKRSLIDRIAIKISEQYYNEKVILDRYVIIIREWYFSEVLGKKLNGFVKP